MMRRFVPAVFILVLAFGTTVISFAQSAPWRIVQASDGSLYLIVGDGRYSVQPAAIADDELAAIPDLGSLSGDLPPLPMTERIVEVPVTDVATPATPVPTATQVPLTWMVPQMTPMGQSTSYDPGSSPAGVMFQCNGHWNGQDDENTYAVVHFPGPTTLYGVKFGSYAWNGTGSLGTTGTMWLRNAGLLTEPGSDGRPLWHNNFRGDNDATGGWSSDGVRANQIAPAFPNGPAGLTFAIPWNLTTYYTFTFSPVTVTDLRVELMDAGGGGSFTTLIGGLHILTSPSTPGTAC